MSARSAYCGLASQGIASDSVNNSCPARDVAFGRLDLDHVRAVVGEQPGAVRRRDGLAEFHDLDAFESSGHGLPPGGFVVHGMMERRSLLPYRRRLESGTVTHP